MNHPAEPKANLAADAPLQEVTPSPEPDSNSATRAMWVQARAAMFLGVLTLFLVILTGYYAWLTRQTVAATKRMVEATEKSVEATERMVAATEKTVAVQIDPVVTLETRPGGEPTLVLSNTGSAPVVEVSVYLERVLVFGPPANEVMGPIEVVRCDPPAGCAFWNLSRLEPGRTVRQSFFQEAATALESAKKLNDAKAAGRMEAPKKILDSTLHPILSFRVTFLREVDRKPYSTQKAVLIVPESGSGKPYVIDGTVASVIGYFRETLGVLNPNR